MSEHEPEPRDDAEPRDEPSTDVEPDDEPPAEQQPDDEPAVDEPAVDEPAVDEPAVDEPAVDEPAVDEPAVDEPAVDEPGPNRHRAAAPAPGRRRTTLTRPRGVSRAQLVIGVLLALLGFALVTQLRAREADDAYAGLRSADLVQVLNGLNAQSRRAEAEVSDLQRTRSQLTSSTQRREAATSRAREEASTLGILAGTVAATGPGIRVTIDDPADKLSLNNLLDAVEELRAAGAEAMEFNDTVRVVASTSFEQTGDGLIVGGQRLSAPYVIDAIGNPDTLAPVLDIAEGFGYDVDQAGGTVSVDKVPAVKIAAVVKVAPDDFATPQG